MYYINLTKHSFSGVDCEVPPDRHEKKPFYKNSRYYHNKTIIPTTNNSF